MELHQSICETLSVYLLRKYYISKLTVGAFHDRLTTPDTLISPILIKFGERQGCARLIFPILIGLTRLWLIWQTRWLNSDSTQIPNLLTRLNSDSTQNPNSLTWLNSDSSHLSQSLVKSDSRLITFYLIWEKVVDRGGGGAVECSCRLVHFCKVTDNCKILTFSLRKISDSTLTQAVSSWLNSDSNDGQRDSTLTQLIFLIFTADSTLTRLIWVRVESNLTHDSWVEHNPGERVILHAKNISRSPRSPRSIVF